MVGEDAGVPSPKLRDLADEMAKVVDQIEEIDKRREDLVKEKENFKKVILEQMKVQGVLKFSTLTRNISYKKKEKFTIKNWNSLVAFVLREGRVDIFQKRPSEEVVKELRERDGKLPDGIEAFPLESIEFSKIRGTKTA